MQASIARKTVEEILSNLADTNMLVGRRLRQSAIQTVEISSNGAIQPQPSRYLLEEVAARLQRMGQDAAGKGDEIVGEGATPVDSSGTGTRDQGPWQSQQVGDHGKHSAMIGPAHNHPVADSVDRWAEKVSSVLQ